ncbi:hypothetical protein AJ78_06099 [Emergomyces pasteurianus Ep9510]|uniref:PH domain-containing protein n=1 Tax=Emergomyces pasteurianus Ep9510 TaxID=1447872 RepID=A0A1J9QE34_9EURO|nr:hypothetical protein AJ78_06099 [Emergomyces pasteurianus Ep9510]
MSFGFSPSDVFKLIEICHYVVVNCRHGPTSAVQAINGLREEVLEFEDLLKQFHHILEETDGVSCIELRGVETTLRECRDHLEKYSALQQQFLGSGHLGPPRPRLSIRRSREILAKSKIATRMGGEIVRHLAWGEKDIIALRERIERHKQSLGLYLTVLEREKTVGIGNRITSMENTIAALRVEVTSTSSRVPTQLDRGASFSFPIDAGIPYATDRYQAILATVERQREFAMLERNRADAGEDEEWETICDQLDLFHRRVLNAIERKANSSVQHRNGYWPSHFELNKALLSRSAINAPLKRVSTENNACYLEPTSPLPPLHEEGGYRFEAGSTISTVSQSTSPLPSVFSFSAPSRTATTSTVDSIDPLMVDTNVSDMKHRPPSSTTRQGNRNYERKLQAISPTSPLSDTESSHRPSFASSNGSGGQRSWKALQLSGWVKILWDSNPSPVYCNLEAGYRSDGRLYAIKAVDLRQPQRQLPVIKLSSAERRPIPHTEPPGPRDAPEEALRVYFVKQPVMKRGEEGVQYFFENQTDQFKFQSLIYGQKLILATVIQKISSVHGKESDRQYIRIWENTSEGNPRSFLYLATSRPNLKYIEINEKQISPNYKISSRSNILELKVLTQMQHLRITFTCQSDLQDFVNAMFAAGPMPRNA